MSRLMSEKRWGRALFATAVAGLALAVVAAPALAADAPFPPP